MQYNIIAVMIRVSLAIALAVILSACGAGQVQCEEQHTERQFISLVNGAYGTVEGQGVSLLDRQYDAIAYIATFYKAGSTEYRQMVSDAGLAVTLVDRATGKGITGIVHIRNDGMHIDMI